MLICISADSREAVDEITEKALAAGGREPREKQDYGFMYGRSFEDLDGHIWEPMWMDMEPPRPPGRAGPMADRMLGGAVATPGGQPPSPCVVRVIWDHRLGGLARDRLRRSSDAQAKEREDDLC